MPLHVCVPGWAPGPFYMCTWCVNPRLWTTTNRKNGLWGLEAGLDAVPIVLFYSSYLFFWSYCFFWWAVAGAVARIRGLAVSVYCITSSSSQCLHSLSWAHCRQISCAHHTMISGGSVVCLSGLLSQVDLNGAQGVCKEFNASTQRYTVRLDSPERLGCPGGCVKQENIVVISAAESSSLTGKDPTRGVDRYGGTLAASVPRVLKIGHVRGTAASLP